jgi:hypothetical protein
MKFQFFLVLASIATLGAIAAEPKIIRVGMIGLDTSHVTAFTKILHDPANGYPVRVVAAFPQSSPDIESSYTKMDGYVKTLSEEYGVKMMESIEAMLPLVDVVMIESVDGRPHLAQARPCLQAGKPTFIDKPAAATLADAMAIYALARETGTPVWSASNLRFHPGVVKAAQADVGEIAAAVSFGPAPLEEHHPDLAWYGIHPTEALFTVLGPECLSVTRTHTEGTDVVTGVWEGGRVGTVLGLRASKSVYGVKVFGSKAVIEESAGAAYPELMKEMVAFFKTGKPPVSEKETLAIMAFIAAADASKERGGVPVTLAEMLETPPGQ